VIWVVVVLSGCIWHEYEAKSLTKNTWLLVAAVGLVENKFGANPIKEKN